MPEAAMTGVHWWTEPARSGRGRRFGDVAAVVVPAPAHQRPAVVLARLGDVDLVAAHRPVLDLPEGARLRMDRRGLDVAVAVGPDLRARIAAADEGVVLRHGAVRVDAQNLAQMTGEVLRRIELEALAGGDEELAVAREGKARAEMVAAADLRHLAKDHLGAFERRRRFVEASARHRRRGAALAGLGEGQVD